MNRDVNIVFSKNQINTIYSVCKSGKIYISKDTFNYLYTMYGRMPELYTISLHKQINIAINKTLKQYRNKDWKEIQKYWDQISQFIKKVNEAEKDVH